MKDFASAVNSAVGGSIVIAPRTGLTSNLGMDQTSLTEVPPTAIESQVDGKHEVGLKFDDDKPRYDLEQTLATEEVMKVLTFGARKYDDGNWKFLDKAQARYYAAARRHLAATQRGETIDPESGLHHLAHAICCLNFMLELQLESKND
jgi:hypothetical protein